MSEQIANQLKDTFKVIKTEYDQSKNLETGSIYNEEMLLPEEAEAALANLAPDSIDAQQLRAAFTSEEVALATNTISSILQEFADPNVDFEAKGEILKATLILYSYLELLGIASVPDFLARLQLIDRDFLENFFDSAHAEEDPQVISWATQLR